MADGCVLGANGQDGSCLAFLLIYVMKFYHHYLVPNRSGGTGEQFQAPRQSLDDDNDDNDDQRQEFVRPILS
jgi:hypothetical protein